jgi:hypothetical protein
MRSLSSLASNTTLLLLALQQLHSPPSEEVERVAVRLLGARFGCGMFVSSQRALLEEVAQGVVVTIRSDIAYV